MPFDSDSGDNAKAGGVPGAGGGRQADPFQLNPGLHEQEAPEASSSWPPEHCFALPADPDPAPLMGQAVAAKSACHTALLSELRVDMGVAGQSLACSRTKSHFAPMSGEQVSHDPSQLMGLPSALAPE